MGSSHEVDDIARSPAPVERRRDLVNAAIIDALPSSVALLDGDGIIRAVNAGWVRFGLERSLDGVVADAGTSYLDITDRAAEAGDVAAKEAADAIRAVLAGERDLAVVEYPRPGTPSPGWFTMRVASVSVEDDRWAVVTHDDVTELSEARDRWQSTFTRAAVATAVVDGRNRIVEANRALARLLGCDVLDLEGSDVLEVVEPADHALVEGRRARALAGDPDPEPAELRLRRADGSAVVVMMHPSFIAVGSEPRAVVQLVDITGRRRAERRLELQRELLELVAGGTPLPEVALAVAANVGRVVDGASGVVLLHGEPAVISPDLAIPWLPFVGPLDGAAIPPDAAARWPFTGTWSVAVTRPTGEPSGAVVAVTESSRAPSAEDADALGLLASVLRLALQRDETARALAAASRHDSLSDLPTVELLGERIRSSIDSLRATDGCVAVLAVGVHDFDDLLARDGWRGAELAITHLARRVKDAEPRATVVRRSNHVIALVEVERDDDAAALAQRLTTDDVAIGVATASRADAEADELLGLAEERLAAARRRRSSAAEDEAADDLRRGLAAGEVAVHYQPIVDLKTGRTRSLEALVRWHHPRRGLVPPPELIHVAEQCGLINEVGALVLATACRDLARWRAAGAADLSVSVNLSGRQLADPDLVATVRGALRDCGVEASALVVEITESVVVDDVDQAVAALAALRALGVRVAIDDFGTGYSSLLYLKRFPADVLKVDRSFVQGLGVHDGDTAIVDAVVGLAHRLGLEVVAEGVETGEQLAELRRRRCDHAQGYLLQRPAPAEELDRFLDVDAVALGPDPEPWVDDPRTVTDALERNMSDLDDLLRSIDGPIRTPTTLDASPIDLPGFVTQTVADLGPLLALHDVGVAVDEPVNPVEAAPVAVRQILTILLANAVKLTVPGTAIDVVVRPWARGVEVAIVDHGPGIPADRERELFDRVDRPNTTTRDLGLGLHLASALARGHGGDLVHEHTPGGGATFILRLVA